MGEFTYFNFEEVFLYTLALSMPISKKKSAGIFLVEIGKFSIVVKLLHTIESLSISTRNIPADFFIENWHT